MNIEQAMSKCNPQAVEIDDMARSTNKVSKGASYDEVLGFQCDDFAVSVVAYLMLIDSKDACSLKRIAREIKRRLNSVHSIETIQGACYVYFNRHDDECKGRLCMVSTPVYKELSELEGKAIGELNMVDRE